MRVLVKHLVGLGLLLGAVGSASVGAVAAASPCPGGDPTLVGTYQLKGVMNVGSKLVLRKDGSFDYRLSYGVVDQKGKGCWVREGTSLSLIPAGADKVSKVSVLDSTAFTGLALDVDGDALIWNIGESGGRGRYER